MVKRDSTFQRMRFHCSWVQWRRYLHHLHHPDGCITHGDLRHVAARPLKPISWSSRYYCADVASRGSLELGSECCNWGQTIFMLYALQHSVLWACVAYHFAAEPRCFHFAITALTVDRGSSSRTEIWQTDLLERCHAMTVPHWKLLSSQ
jgi:hypothetical protein